MASAQRHASVEPCSSTAESLVSNNLSKHLPATTTQAKVDQLTWSEALASCSSDAMRAITPDTTDNSHSMTAASHGMLPAQQQPEKQAVVIQQEAPQPICRRDMSTAALAVHAGLNLHTASATPASPPSTDAREVDINVESEPGAKRQKRVFIHGNYNRYYGYRLGSELEEDPRLKVCQ